jgi:signal transduction histidine kinase
MFPNPSAPTANPSARCASSTSLARLWQSLALALLAIVLSSAVGLAVSVLLAHRIARRLAEPITTLARVSSEIALSQDYSQRLPAGGRDEIGTAMNAFNDMLDEIRVRGEALLEHKVADRTVALRRQKESAEAASLAKTRFLSNMSHELRTPLNAVIRAAQLLQDRTDVDDPQAHLVEVIRSSGTRLLGLIENILDLSRIESGALDLAAEDFNLVDCVEAAVATSAVAARQKGCRWPASWRHSWVRGGTATRCACARCCSTCWATRSSSRCRARWCCAWTPGRRPRACTSRSATPASE